MTTKSAVKRIAKLEAYMDEVIEARKAGVNVQKDKELHYKVSILSKYMKSGAWLSDYTRQEKGDLPKDMKCGILSQDTLYDLLTDIDKEKRTENSNSRTIFTKKRAIIISVILILLISLIAWIWWGNTTLEVNQYTIVSERLPKEFNGFTIAHLSDLHNEEIKGVIPELTEAKPDIIVITGDIIDGEGMDVTLRFAKDVTQIAPCYYVTGNHESRISQEIYAVLETGLKDAGITVLHDEKILIEKNGKEISLIGIDDPSFRSYVGTESPISQSLITALKEENTFTILLSHRPELFDLYVEADVDLALSGHAHGGQVRIPFIGGIVAPNQGLFPQYDAGLFTENNTHMIVSRGIGNGTVVPRVNNRPEIILIELQSAKN